MSSLHSTKAIYQESQKPEIVEFYNFTKGGVDALDEKCAKMSTSRRSRRWPLTIFYTILNIASVNAYIIYSNFSTKKLKRLYFVKNLARQLVSEHLERRLVNTHLPRALRQNIAMVLKKKVPLKAAAESSLRMQSTCSMCKKQKTIVTCISCRQHICNTCAKSICEYCVAEDL